MNLLYQNQDIRQCENRCYQRDDLSPAELMRRAGSAAFRYLQSRYPNARSIVCCCGAGNNGGDGFVLARLAKEQGFDVNIVMLSDKLKMRSEYAQAAMDSCIELNIRITQFHADMFFDQADVIVDALLGIGLNGEVREPYASMIFAINQSASPVLSLDVPSGLVADTGYVHDQAVHADSTISFIALKVGLFTGQGAAYCGAVIKDDLGLPAECLDDMQPTAETVCWQHINPLLKKRRRDAHKGHHGHTLVIGGDYGMGGAVRMAAEAALRVGAGLVTVATRPEHVPIVSGTRPEIMCHQISEPGDIDPLLERCNVIVIGPGLGQTDWAKGLLEKVLETQCKKVLDADALNLLSHAPHKIEDAVLTPHPGEAARLLDCSSRAIAENRFSALERLVDIYSSTIVLKGSGTLLGAEHIMTKLCCAGNPGMATAGMGDMLTGVIGGLIAQGLSCYQAAEAGVLIHATAADAAADVGGERGLLATDLLDYLRELVNPYDEDV